MSGRPRRTIGVVLIVPDGVDRRRDGVVRLTTDPQKAKLPSFPKMVLLLTRKRLRAMSHGQLIDKHDAA
jgi:hypothetical protein